MNMKAIKSFYILFLVMLLVLPACNEDDHSPINNGGDTPGQVSNPVAVSLPGATKISYQLPSDKNFLYVKAQTEIRKGVIREVKASYYTSNLIIDGFGDTTEYTVNLYSVGRNNLESNPVSVTVKPKTPPVFSIYESIISSVQETFGGIRFGMENPAEAEVRIYVNTPDSLGSVINAETFYTSAIKDNFSVRGYDTIARPFAIYVQDRWGNTSDVYEKVFHPWYEEKLNKTKFRGVQLPGDMTDNVQQGRVIIRLWDDGLTDNTMYQTNSGVKNLPHTFTIDLGAKVNLSRVLVHGRVSTQALYIYNAGMPKEWEIYGSMNPNADGSWDNWIPLRNTPCVSFKPSGLEVGQVNDDDVQRQKNGEEFEFDASDIPVRYLRWKVNSVWGGTSLNFFNMTEITLFGNVLETYN